MNDVFILQPTVGKFINARHRIIMSKIQKTPKNRMSDYLNVGVLECWRACMFGCLNVRLLECLHA